VDLRRVWQVVTASFVVDLVFQSIEVIEFPCIQIHIVKHLELEHFGPQTIGVVLRQHKVVEPVSCFDAARFDVVEVESVD